ncbi:ROK family protein [Alienimonas sp. DA493]|uniref:ROK family protein n=1 Tax=Alienimonas sp. DA493 TaxID=3373605 RepID=UPI0037542B7F
MPLSGLTTPDGPPLLGIDVGGTNIKAAVVDAGGVVRGKGSVPTEQELGPDAGLDRIEAAANAALEDAGVDRAEIAAVGLATPGPMNLKTGTLLCPSNLPGWRNWAIREAVETRFGKPTTLQNDANAAAYGEYWSGAGRDADSLVLWTLGTGIGCGIILRDAVIEGEHSHGSECGHIIIDCNPDARVHPGTGMRGTLEAYCGARGVVARTRDALDVDRGESLMHERLAGGTKLTPKLICEAADDGDELALNILTETAALLGVGTVSILHTIDPDSVLLAGAMTFGGPGTTTGDLFLDTLRREVQRRAFPTVAEHLDVGFAALGADAGVVGAAGCARRAFAG